MLKLNLISLSDFCSRCTKKTKTKAKKRYIPNSDAYKGKQLYILEISAWGTALIATLNAATLPKVKQ